MAAAGGVARTALRDLSLTSPAHRVIRRLPARTAPESPGAPAHGAAGRPLAYNRLPECPAPREGLATPGADEPDGDLNSERKRPYRPA